MHGEILYPHVDSCGWPKKKLRAKFMKKRILETCSENGGLQVDDEEIFLALLQKFARQFYAEHSLP
jgi:hypothetical protein